MSGLGPEARALLAKQRVRDNPTRANRERVRAKLGAAFGASVVQAASAKAQAAGAAHASAASTPSSFALLSTKAAVIAIATGSLAAAVYVSAPRPATRSTAGAAKAETAASAALPRLPDVQPAIVQFVAAPVPPAQAEPERARAIAQPAPAPEARAPIARRTRRPAPPRELAPARPAPPAPTPVVESPALRASTQAAPPPAEPPAASAAPLAAPPPVPAAAPVVAQAAPATVAQPMPQLESAPPEVTALRVPAPSLAGELTLIDEAQRALQHGDPSRALALLERHALRYPSGSLAQERLVTQALALCELGRGEQAQHVLHSLARQAPQSPMLARVRASCRAALAP